MTKREIFDDIVNIMRNDASCCKDKKGGDTQKYQSMIDETMTDKDFTFVVNSYLATFKVLAHLGLECKKFSNWLQCSLRMYEGKLYVVAAPKESGMGIGHTIVAVDGVEISEFARRHSEFLFDESEERQGFLWENLLSYCDELTLQDGTTQYTVKLPLAGRLPHESCSFAKLREDVAYLLLNTFAQEELIVNLINSHKSEILACRYLVMDVRNNDGGLDSAFFPLLEFCLYEHDEFCGQPILPNDKIEINYTERNVDERLKMLEYFRKNAQKDLVLWFDDAIAQNKAQRGKGFVVEADSDTYSYPMRGTDMPKRVFVLTDCNCGSSGDQFVMAISPLSKVTVVGRPTMGILDYSNLAMKDYGDYVLRYPTSRRLAIDKGEGMSCKGVPVDVYVPWNIGFLQKDKDLEKVFELIDKNQ